MTFQLQKYNNYILNNFMNFMNSDIYHNTLLRKFNITRETNINSQIHKYLSGYNILPHPDKR